MARIKLMTDSGSDISAENEDRYNIHVVPFMVTFGERNYISRVDFDNETFYKMLNDCDSIPTTSQITPYEFLAYFEEYYKFGYTDIINVSINSEGSGTHSNAVLAAADFFEAHPDAKGRFMIHNIDSGTYTGCYGFAVVEAAKMIQYGASPEKVVFYIKKWCERSATYFVPYTLKYAAKSGRIPAIAQYAGDLLGLKPMMFLHDHKISVTEKVRSEKNIIPCIIKRVSSEMAPGTPYCVIYGSDEAVRNDLARQLTAVLGYPPADVYQLGAAISANAGPRTVGALFQLK